MNSSKFWISQIRSQFSPDKYHNTYQAPKAVSNYEAFQNRRYTIPAGTPGSGAGRGGGAGGSIKESGGGLGRYGAAQEEGYFYHKDKEQLGKLKENIKSEPPKEKQPAEKPDE